MKAGDVLHLTRAASPQFVRPIFLRLIKIRTDLHTYDGWTWLDGYQLDEKGEATARRELYVLKAGVRLVGYSNSLPAKRPGPPARQATQRISQPR